MGKMPWTYSGDPSTSEKDALRFLIGDTDPDDPLLSDSEVEFLINRMRDVDLAAAEAAYSLAGRYSRMADKSVGDLSISLSQKAAAFLELADKLRRKAQVLAVPFAGGISLKQKATIEADSDRVPPAFSRDMFKNE